MERITISLEDELAVQFKAFINERGYKNRSEAIRDLIREKIENERLEQTEGTCIGTLTYLYDHHERELAKRLTQEHHHHHDLSISTLHVHLDHDNCMETVIVKGNINEVQEFANNVISQSGVRHGKLYLIPVEMKNKHHIHGDHAPKDDQKGHSHEHISPKS
ncbi:MAG: Nickel responsive regulator NikR [uncultured Thiotrichaceae bacterium]|uniref:Putative nickel-responsive regulator n=1 Tax=uncultured Thiotrichaceae bacterium TaxID=298394 RepID=A0A6S6T4V9_9GAMM|nr:MAG: Nickel responsive regulator NikR [uncultured Thiotrichaceae bacterium]